MFRSVFAVGCIYAALSLYMARALTDEQKEEHIKEFENKLIECMKENAISEEDVAILKAKQNPRAGSNSGCFLACFMRMFGVMDDEGMLPKEVPAELAKSMYDSDDEELKKVHNFLDLCSVMNSEAVTDGKKGCERAMLAYECRRSVVVSNTSHLFAIDT